MVDFFGARETSTSTTTAMVMYMINEPLPISRFNVFFQRFVERDRVVSLWFSNSIVRRKRERNGDGEKGF